VEGIRKVNRSGARSEEKSQCGDMCITKGSTERGEAWSKSI